MYREKWLRPPSSAKVTYRLKTTTCAAPNTQGYVSIVRASTRHRLYYVVYQTTTRATCLYSMPDLQNGDHRNIVAHIFPSTPMTVHLIMAVRLEPLTT